MSITPVAHLVNKFRKLREENKKQFERDHKDYISLIQKRLDDSIVEAAQQHTGESDIKMLTIYIDGTGADRLSYSLHAGRTVTEFRACGYDVTKMSKSTSTTTLVIVPRSPGSGSCIFIGGYEFKIPV